MIQANLLLSRPFIKINACVIGYGLWLIMSQHQMITEKIIMPICFYDLPEKTSIQAPDHAEIIIKGSRQLLRQFDITNTAIHLDASSFSNKEHYVVLQKENLFFPDNIHLINVTPSVIQVQLQKTE